MNAGTNKSVINNTLPLSMTTEKKNSSEEISTYNMWTIKYFYKQAVILIF